MPLKPIQSRDPVHLKNKYSKGLRRMPELAEDSPEFRALCAGMEEKGITEAILLDESDHVIDDHSRNLLRAALRWQLKEVPVQVHSSHAAPMIRITRLAHFRHLSKSAIAYLAAPDLAEAFEEARAVMLKKLRENPENAGVASGHSQSETVEELADKLGVDRKTLFEARKVRKEFESPKKYSWEIKGGSGDGSVVELTFKEWFEPKLLRAYQGGEHEHNRPIGLGGIIAGLEAKKKDPEEFNPKKTDQLELFERKVDFVGGWQYYVKLSPQQRAKHLENFEDQLEFVPEEQRDELADYFESLAKRVRKNLNA